MRPTLVAVGPAEERRSSHASPTSCTALNASVAALRGVRQPVARRAPRAVLHVMRARRRRLAAVAERSGA
jgi:hypothetical protein